MLASIDHVVLTTSDLGRATDFYCGVLQMRRVEFGAGYIAFEFGRQKLNVQVRGHESWLRASQPTPGALDICFLAAIPLDAVMDRLAQAGIPLECGPEPRTGGCGPMRSVYVRDPDGNLVEIAQPVAAPSIPV